MRRSKLTIVLGAATAVLVGLALAGCSDDSNDPYGPGPVTATFNSGTLNAPATYVHTFTTAAVVGYHCNFHRSMGMTGTVTVVANAADSVIVSASGTTFTPVAVSIKPGGYVRWNVTGETHTVTSN